MRLYLDINGWKEMLLSQDTLTQLNWILDGMENPTKYTSENSYNVTLPKCAQNDVNLSMFRFRDAAIGTFQPNKRIPAMIVSNQQQVISKGSVVLDSVNDNGYVFVYYGSKATALHTLFNSGWDRERAGEVGYTILGDPFYPVGGGFADPGVTRGRSIPLNKDLVWASFNNPNPLSWSTVKGMTDSEIINHHPIMAENPNITPAQMRATSFIGFAQTSQGHYQSFNSGAWCQRISTKIGATDQYALVYNASKQNLMVDGITDTWTGNKGNRTYDYSKLFNNNAMFVNVEGPFGFEVIETQMNELRSYYQQPYVYVKALFDQFDHNNQIKSLTGYDFTYDSNIFEEGDANVIYMLPQCWSDHVDEVEKSDWAITTVTGGSYTHSATQEGRIGLGDGTTGQVWNGAFFSSTGVFLDRRAGVGSASPINFPGSGAEMYSGQAPLFIPAGKTIEVAVNAEYNINIDSTTGLFTYSVPGRGNIVSDFYFIAPNSLLLVDLEVYDGHNAPVYTKRECLNLNVMYHDPDDNSWSNAYTGTDQQNGGANLDDCLNCDRHVAELIKLGYEYKVVDIPVEGVSGASTRSITVPINTSLKLNAPSTGEDLNYYAMLHVKWSNTSIRFSAHPPVGGNPLAGSGYKYYLAMPRQSTYTLQNVDVKTRIYDNLRSGRSINAYNIFGSISPWDIMLKYSKLKHLHWFVDDENHVIRVMKSTTFYNEANPPRPLDSIVDYKGVVMKPFGFNEDALVFNLEAPDTEFMGDYEPRWGMTYGSKKILTDNKRNSSANTLELLDKDKIVAPVDYSERFNPITNVTSEGINPNPRDRIIYYNHMMPLNKMDDESKNVSGNFYYRLKGVKRPLKATLRFSTYRTRTDVFSAGESTMWAITDDFLEELNADEYAWHGDYLYQGGSVYYITSLLDRQGAGVTTAVGPVSRPESYVLTSALPAIQSYCSTQSLVFGKPYEVYSANSELVDKPTLYDTYWKDYIEEVYNIKNRSVEIKAMVSAADYIYLKKNPFVTVGDVLYVIVKIENWNEGKFSKLTLRRVDDIRRLTGAEIPPTYRTLAFEDANGNKKKIVFDVTSGLIVQDNAHPITRDGSNVTSIQINGVTLHA